MIEPVDEQNLRARYDALLEFSAEKMAKGEQVHGDLLAQINNIRAQYPEWPTPPPLFVTPPPPPPPPVLKASVPISSNERPLIIVDENMERISTEVLNVWGARFSVFQAGGRLLEVQKDNGAEIKYLAREPDSPRMVVVGGVRARSLASRECRFAKKKTTKDGAVIFDPQLPPDWLGPTLTARTDFPGIPIFSGLAQAPTLRRDGALVCEPGYDASTGIYLTSNFKVSVPENPTREDAVRCGKILLDLLCDFEFTNPAAKSVWLAGLLSIVCRHTFTGPAPIFVFDAAKRGVGKTRMADMISFIATGRSAPRMVYVHNEIEMDKRITSLGLAGDQLVLLDNVVGKLSSPSLELVLTCDTYKGRVLQKSEMTVAMPMRMVWLVTGNGMYLGADIARRALTTRIEPTVEYPEYRSGPQPGTKWKYRLPDYCLEARAELLSCALTMVAAYIRAGLPKIILTADTGPLEMGSFEKWADIIRNTIVWSEADDPCATIKDAQAADLDSSALRTMLECWPVPNNVEVSTAELIEKADIPLGDPLASAAKKEWRNALLGWLPAKGGATLPTARDLGCALRGIKGSIVENYKLESCAHTKYGTPWKRTQILAKILQFPIEDSENQKKDTKN